MKSLVIACWIIMTTAKVDSNSETILDDYIVCKNHYAGSRIQKTTYTKRRILCAMYCSRFKWCRAVTIYKESPTRHQCNLHDGIYGLECNSFPTVETIQVRMLIKKDNESSPLENGCYNGASRDGSGCVCRLGFAGATCERYIYDCKEGKDLGISNLGILAFMVKPMNSEFAFEILCNSVFGMSILVARRFNLNTNFVRTMNEYKYSFGYGEDFWCGLEGMHALLNQPGTEFKLQIYCYPYSDTAEFSVFYHDFKVGGEAKQYASRNTGMYPAPDNSDGLGAGKGPMPFCAYDERGSCPGQPPGTDGGWWYTLNNTAYSLTSKDRPKWPYDGNLVQCSYISMQVEKIV
ncbi:uncharacterized protein LOC126807902 [Patella vulgata]|uniref:uncharacterized protein LOC126807902 n=1 Tax=Patella vulgata TaxID=6465 RepID=UPI00217FC3D8|nr:uncharacterized protein LOC126807902 [Patella vulgata]